jgi:hypothetical protein
MQINTLRRENSDILKELKTDRVCFREKDMTVQEAGKAIGFANATCHAIKIGLDIEKFSREMKR